jgi:hypothetical protein
MLRALAAALLLPIPAAAAAQVREQPIDEVAADLAYGFCPLFLAGQFSLTGPELEERGFAKTISKQPNPRSGEISVVEAKRPNGRVAFGGAVGKVCMVVVDAPTARTAVLARLRSSMAFTGLDFQPVPNPGPGAEGLAALSAFSVETYKASVENQFLYLQHIHMDGPAGTGVVVAQLFASDK